MPLPFTDQADRDLSECVEMMRGGSKTFFAASRLLPKRIRDAAIALYAFCRVADDMVDLGDSWTAFTPVNRKTPSKTVLWPSWCNATRCPAIYWMHCWTVLLGTGTNVVTTPWKICTAMPREWPAA